MLQTATAVAALIAAIASVLALWMQWQCQRRERQEREWEDVPEDQMRVLELLYGNNGRWPGDDLPRYMTSHMELTQDAAHKARSELQTHGEIKLVEEPQLPRRYELTDKGRETLRRGKRRRPNGGRG